jgi:hypothetical protein
MCCPLQECDDWATVYNTKVRVARKEHVCDECHEIIPAKANYEYISMLFDGHWDSFSVCLSCWEIGDHFACGNGRVLGTLWNDIEENFFPDMAAGGHCMDGLSPAAKARLFERRLQWMFDSELEIDGARPPRVPK